MKYLIGIDVGGTNIKIMIMTEMYICVSKSSIKTHVELGYETITDNIVIEIDRMFKECDVEKPVVAAVAMGVPGIVDKKEKKTIRLNKVHWDGFDPSAKIGKYYNAPSYLANDANLNALGEYFFGAGRGVKSLILLTLGTGVGGGIILNGKMLEGEKGFAAELGHMTIVSDGGNVCLCGHRGCLEAYASGSALAREANQMIETHQNTKLHEYIRENNGIYENKMIVRGVYENDELCIEIMEWFVHYLSIGVSNFMKMLNPGVILLGGGIAEAGELLLAPVNQQCKERVFHESQYCMVKKAALGAEAGVYGACILAGSEIGINPEVHICDLDKEILGRERRYGK